MVFITTDSFQSKDIERRREEHRKDEKKSRAVGFDDKAKDGKDDAQEGGDDGGQLGALAEGCCNKEGPTREDQAEEEMDDENEPRVGSFEDLR